MAAQDAELKLKVSLDLAFFRQQLTGLGQAAAGYNLPINVSIDRGSIQKELNALGANFKRRNYKLEVKTNLDTEIKKAKELTELLKGMPAGSPGKPGAIYQTPGTKIRASALMKTLAMPGQGGFDANAIRALAQKAVDVGLKGVDPSKSTTQLRKDLRVAFDQAGDDATRGLINSLLDGRTSVGKAASGLGEGILAALRTSLKTQSPSKETRKIGKDTADGLEIELIKGLDKIESRVDGKVKDILASLKQLAMIRGFMTGGISMEGMRGQQQNMANFARMLMASAGGMAGIIRMPGGFQERGRLQQSASGINAAMTGGAFANIRARQQGVRGQAAAVSSVTPSFMTALPLLMGMKPGELKSRLQGLYGQQFRAPQMGGYARPNEQKIDKLIDYLARSASGRGSLGAAVSGTGARSGILPGTLSSGYIGRSALSAAYVNYPVGMPAAYGAGFMAGGGLPRMNMASGSMGRFPLSPMMGAGFGAGAGSFIPMQGGNKVNTFKDSIAGLVKQAQDAAAAIRRNVMPTFADLRAQAIQANRRRAISWSAEGGVLGGQYLTPKGNLGSYQMRGAEGMMLPEGITTNTASMRNYFVRQNAIGGGRLGAGYTSGAGEIGRYQFPMAGMMGPSSPSGPYGQINAQTSMFGPSGPAGPGNRPPGGIFGGYGGRTGGGGIVPPGGFPSNDMMGPQSQLGQGYFAAGKAINAFSESFAAARSYLNTNRLPLGGAIAEVGAEFGNAVKQVLLFGTAYKALAFLTDLPNQAFEAAKGLATYRNQLQAVTGNAADFERSFAFVDNLAKRFNVPLQSARDGFVKLYASMKPAGFSAGEIEGLFTGISKATAAFGLSADKVDRVNYAFAQMASKGQIMSEELKGQLGDVLPGALALFAKAAQMDIPEFSKAMEDGAFKGDAMRQVLGNVAILMNRDFGPAAQGAAKTLQGALNQMQNNLKLMYESMTPIVNQFAATFGPQVNSLIKDVTSTMQVLTGTFMKGSDAVGTLSPRAQAFYDVIQQLRPSVESAGLAIAEMGRAVASFIPFAVKAVSVMLQFAASPFGRAAIMATVAVTAFNGALNLLTKAGLIPAVQSVYNFISGLLKIPAATGAARVGVIALKAALTGIVVAGVLTGLDLLIGKIFNIGEAASTSKDRARELALTLDQLAGMGDLVGLAGKRQEAESQVIIAERLLQTYQKMEKIGFDRLTKQERSFLKEFGEKNPFGRGVTFAEQKLTEALENRGKAQAALEAAQRASDRQREQTQQQLAKIDLSAGEGKDSDKARADQDKLANQAQQLAIDAANRQNALDQALFDHLANLREKDFEHYKNIKDAEFDYAMAGLNSIQARQAKFQKDLFDIEMRRLDAVRKANEQVLAKQQEAQEAARSAAAAETAAVAGAAPMTGGTGRTGLIQGSTGLSTGDHFHIQRADNSPISLQEAMAILAPEVRRVVQQTSGYGMRTHPITGRRRLHAGQDVAGPAGTPLNLAPGYQLQGVAEEGGLGYAASILGPQGQSYKVGHLRKPSGSYTQQRRTEKAVGKEETSETKVFYQQMESLVDIQNAYKLAIEQTKAALAANMTTIFPVAELKLENDLMRIRNNLQMQGMPQEYIEYQETLKKAEYEATIAKEGNAKAIAEYEGKLAPLLEKQKKGVELTKQELAEIEYLQSQIKIRTSNTEELTKAQSEYNVALLEGAIAAMKNADALKQIEETAALVNDAVSGVTGTYKALFKEIAMGEKPVKALKKAQEELADQFLTMFFDFAMKPVEDFFKKTLGGLFGVPDEEAKRKETLAKLEAQLQEQKKIALSTQQTAVNTGQGAVLPSGATQSANSGPVALPAIPFGSGETNVATLPSLVESQFITDVTSLSGSLNSASEAMADSLSKTDAAVWNSAATINTAAEEASPNGATGKKWQQSLGTAVQGIGIAAGSIMGIMAGIQQVKKGGTSNVLGGIGSILLSVGGAIGGISSLIPKSGKAANGAVWKGGFAPFHAFANGGVVQGPTLGLIGEGRFNEAIVPLPDGKSIPVQLGGRTARDLMGGNAPGMPQQTSLNMSFETTKINGVEYVSRDQLEQAMAETRRASISGGARQGMAMTLDKIRQSPSTRSRIGMR